MVERTLILGGGMAGLITGCLNPNCFIIESDMLGGPAVRGPFMIHADDNVKDFYQMLGLPTDTEKARVGYMKDRETVYDSPPSLSYPMEYYIHSRFLSDVAIDIPIPPSIMNGGADIFDIMTVSKPELVNAMHTHIVREGGILLHDRVQGINIINDANIIQINTQMLFGAAKKISTIPAPTFFNLLPPEHRVLNTFLQAEDIGIKLFLTFGVNELPERFDSKIKKYNFVYFIPDENETGIFRRLTRITYNEGRFDFEFTIPIDSVEDFKSRMELDGVSDENMYTMMAVRNSKNVSEFKDMKFIGRNATWNHSIKLNDLMILRESKRC